ncbi:hypothetical protein KIN20_007145 [Parelaphostrongylus tenuis]|uniref:Uncharacterized protein n=1 Tax=Parelaphostrongylus tenuis TaxID=148309 RepID=A0AAD5MV55_PARTN|nr:hypothetical protein KIN20_007145 [Parelaphostrongylus tenuis]
MKTIVTPLVCVLYCVISPSSERQCWRSQILRIRRDYPNGESVNHALSKAMFDIATHFGFNWDDGVLQVVEQDPSYQPIVFKTITKFTIVGEIGKAFEGHAVVHFYDDADSEQKIVAAAVHFKSNEINHIAYNMEFRPENENTNECEYDDYLNALIFSSKT